MPSYDISTVEGIYDGRKYLGVKREPLFLYFKVKSTDCLSSSCKQYNEWYLGNTEKLVKEFKEEYRREKIGKKKVN